MTYDASLSSKYSFEKPNDLRALDLMNASAVAVMKEIPDLVMGYGISDEFRYPTLIPRNGSKVACVGVLIQRLALSLIGDVNYLIGEKGTKLPFPLTCSFLV